MAACETGSRSSETSNVLAPRSRSDCRTVRNVKPPASLSVTAAQGLFGAWPSGARWRLPGVANGFLSFIPQNSHQLRSPHIQASSRSTGHSEVLGGETTAGAEPQISPSSVSSIEPGTHQALTNCATEFLVLITGREPWKPSILFHFRKPSASIIQDQGLSNLGPVPIFLTESLSCSICIFLQRQHTISSY